MKIVLTKDETIKQVLFEMGVEDIDLIKDIFPPYRTNLTQDDIEYLIDKYVR